MSSTVVSSATGAFRKCPFCLEEIFSDARKCKHCGEFVNGSVSKSVLAVFAAGLVIACILAGLRPAASESVLAIGIWAIFALLFAKTFGRV